MMRGPSYDDAYITRKMSQMAGPTFSTPGASSYGRSQGPGYMQRRRGRLAKKDGAMGRSHSTGLPFLWPEVDNDLKERNTRKGWYRVDYGGGEEPKLWFLPTYEDRLNFMERHARNQPSSANFDLKSLSASKPTVRSVSVPPPSDSFKTVDRRGKTTTVTTYQFPRSKSVYAYRTLQRPAMTVHRQPRQLTVDLYYPDPCYRRQWTVPQSLYPITGRGRSLSPPVRVTNRWTDSYTSPYSPYSSSLLPESLDMREERRSMSPSPLSHTSSYRPSASTQLILNRVALGRTTLPNPPPSQYHRGYPPMGPPPRMMPRMQPSYYDYDYPGYGGGYYYMPPPPPPRMSRYDSYLDDGEAESPYLPRYRPRVVDIADTELTDKMLQDHVDKMRIRLKSLAYSLDPTGPVPEIILPERTKKSGASASGHDDKKYQSVLELNELPRLASRRQRYYPEDDQMKENLRIKCLSHYKTTRTQAGYWKPKQFIATEPVLPDSSSRLSKYPSSKWEEPDTVFGGPSDRKPYSKAITDGTTEETSEEKKERRKKKKSKERELTAETASSLEASSSAAPAAYVSASEVDAVSVVSEGDALDDEKERKKLEKKKRKAEREAAAKAAMEAELAALAAAEAELACLEQESSKADGAAPEAASEAAPAEVADEVKSESAAEKCESSGEAVTEGVCVTPDPAPPIPLQTPPQVPPQVLEEPKAVEPLQEPQPEPPVEEPVVEPPVEEPTVEPKAEELLIDEPPPLKDTRVELEVEKPQVEPRLEEAPVVEPPVEEPNVEQLQVTEPEPGVFLTELKVEPPLEEPETPIEAPIEKPAVEEVPVQPPVEEALVEEPVVAPPVEAEVVVEAEVEDESPVWQPRATQHTALDDDEPGWLDEWAGEEQQEEAVGSTKLGTAVGAEGGGEGAAEAGEGTGAGEAEGGEVVDEPAAPTPAEPAPEPEPEPEPAPVDEPTPAPAEDEADVPEISVPVTQRSEEELEE